MTIESMRFTHGPAGDVVLESEGVEVFATKDTQPLLLSPKTLEPSGAAIILEASYWWFDSGRLPEVLRVEHCGGRVTLTGGKRFEPIPGESDYEVGICSLEYWNALVDDLQKQTKKHNKPRRDNHYQPFSFDDSP